MPFDQLSIVLSLLISLTFVHFDFLFILGVLILWDLWPRHMISCFKFISLLLFRFALILLLSIFLLVRFLKITIELRRLKNRFIEQHQKIELKISDLFPQVLPLIARDSDSLDFQILLNLLVDFDPPETPLRFDLVGERRGGVTGPFFRGLFLLWLKLIKFWTLLRLLSVKKALDICGPHLALHLRQLLLHFLINFVVISLVYIRLRGRRILGFYLGMVATYRGQSLALSHLLGNCHVR